MRLWTDKKYFKTKIAEGFIIVTVKPHYKTPAPIQFKLIILSADDV